MEQKVRGVSTEEKERNEKRAEERGQLIRANADLLAEPTELVDHRPEQYAPLFGRAKIYPINHPLLVLSPLLGLPERLAHPTLVFLYLQSLHLKRIAIAVT